MQASARERHVVAPDLGVVRVEPNDAFAVDPHATCSVLHGELGTSGGQQRILDDYNTRVFDLSDPSKYKALKFKPLDIFH